MDSSASLRDVLSTDLRQLANETITNAALYYAVDVTHLDEMIYKHGDPAPLQAVKSSLLASAIGVAGAQIRRMWPVLNFF